MENTNHSSTNFVFGATQLRLITFEYATTKKN